MLGAVADYWRLLLDPEDTSARCRAAASASTRRSPRPKHGSRASRSARKPGSISAAPTARASSFAGIAAQYLAAARDGKRIHDSLQQAIKLDPSLGDAYFGLGLYHYYAAIAPRAARILSVLMFLPGGDRAGGLKEMEQTRSKGMLLRGEADYQLHLIYLWYERQPTTALRLIEGLRSALSAQPVFYLRLAEVQGDYLRNHHGRAADLRIAARRGARRARRRRPRSSEVNARLGMAQEMDALCDSAGRDRTAARGDRAEARGAVCARSRARTINSASCSIARDVDRKRSPRIKRARVVDPRDDRLRMREKIARSDRTRAGAARAAGDLVQNFLHFNHFFVDFNTFLIHNLHLV